MLSNWLERNKENSIGIAPIRNSHYPQSWDEAPKKDCTPLTWLSSRPCWRGHGHGSLNNSMCYDAWQTEFIGIHPLGVGKAVQRLVSHWRHAPTKPHKQSFGGWAAGVGHWRAAMCCRRWKRSCMHYKRCMHYRTCLTAELPTAPFYNKTMLHLYVIRYCCWQVNCSPFPLNKETRSTRSPLLAISILKFSHSSKYSVT